MALIKPTVVTGDLNTFGGNILENGIALRDRYSSINHNHDDSYISKSNNTFKFIETTNELGNQGVIAFVADSSNGVQLSYNSLYRDKGNGLVISNTKDNTSGKEPYLSVEGTIYANTINGNTFTGNAESANKLNPGSKINGILFDGSQDIIVTDDTKLPLTGGTIFGPLSVQGDISNAGLKVQSIVGTDKTASTMNDLYLQYGANKKIFLGEYGTHYISENGSIYTGMAMTANKLQEVRNITLNGMVTGSCKFDGSSDAIINTTIDNIYWKDIKDTPINVSEFINDAGYTTKDSDITGNAATATKAVQDINGNIIIDTYAVKNDTILTGIPTAPTAEVSVNNNQIATTAFVKAAILDAYEHINDEHLKTLDELNNILSNSDEPATSLINGLSNKLDKDETAVAAKKLESGANINDTLFDGSTDISINSIIGTSSADINTKPSDYLHTNGQLKYIGSKTAFSIGLNTTEKVSLIGLNKSIDSSSISIELAIDDNGSLFSRSGTGEYWNNWNE